MTLLIFIYNFLFNADIKPEPMVMVVYDAKNDSIVEIEDGKLRKLESHEQYLGLL